MNDNDIVEVKEVVPEISISPLPIHLLQIAELLSGTTGILSPDNNIDIRCFYLVDGKAFFGIMFLETNDSFLVGATGQLNIDTLGKTHVKPYVSLPILRVLKNSLMGVSKPNPRYSQYYYKYLLSAGIKLLPDFMTDGIIKQVNNLILEIDEAQEIINKEAGLNSRIGQVGLIPGASDFAFRPLDEGKGTVH